VRGSTGDECTASGPGLIENESEGPGGLQIRYDYRSVLSEVLGGVLGCRSSTKCSRI
jgi:hypothetical protein